jgi:hypothetical protein
LRGSLHEQHHPVVLDEIIDAFMNVVHGYSPEMIE